MGNKSGRLKKLEVFHLRRVRRILGISLDNMRDEKLLAYKLEYDLIVSKMLNYKLHNED